MADIKIENKNEETVITVDGELTIEHAAELKKALQQSLDYKTHVISLDLSKVSAMDLSALQLFCSAHKTSVTLKKTLKLLRNNGDIFKEIVKRSGYMRYSGCTKETDKSCLWIVGD